MLGAEQESKASNLRGGILEQPIAVPEPSWSNQKLGEARQSSLERVATELNADVEESIGWTGHLTWDDGTPAVGLVIRARHPDSDLPLCQAKSDAHGKYRLALEGRFSGYKEFEDIDLSCDGYYAKEPEWPRAQPGSPFTVIDIVFERGTPLEVKAVHKESGAPAVGVWIHANCETDWMHEVWGQTDESGLLRVFLPHLGPWAFMGIEPGIAMAPEAIFWLKPGDQGVTLNLWNLPQALHLVAQDIETGAPIPQASFHGARVPDDVRQLPEQAYVELPISLPAKDGVLEMTLPSAGRVFVQVNAEGYFSEVAEIVLASDLEFQVPLIPLQESRVGVTRHGEPVAAKMMIGFNRHTLLYPSGPESDLLALRPQCAPVLRFDLAAERENTIQLPASSALNSPDSFDLWIESGGATKYFGVVHRDALPAQPWIFELAPKQGKVVVQVRDAEGHPQTGVNVQIRYQIDLESRDAASASTDGLISKIYRTDENGEVHADFAAPSAVVATVSQGWNGVTAEGRLQPESELVLNIQMENPFDPNAEEVLPTSGRVQFEGALPEGLAYDGLSISILPDSFFGEYMIFLNENGEWAADMPAGTYTATLDADPSSQANGHSIRFASGTDNNLLLLPSPSGLLLNIREFGSGQTLMADDVDLWVDGTWLTWMEAYADGSAGSQMLFADRVQYDVEKEGYIPTFGVVDLRPGIIVETEVLLRPARTLVFQYPSAQQGSDISMLWLDPPNRSFSFPIEIADGLWTKATTDTCRLQAIDAQQRPIGPPFSVESGLAERTVMVPLFLNEE